MGVVQAIYLERVIGKHGRSWAGIPQILKLWREILLFDGYGKSYYFP
jgi:hypothetical protein